MGIHEARDLANDNTTHRELLLRIVTYLKLTGWYVLVTPRGGLPGQPGVPDLLAFKTDRKLAIECKVGRDKLSVDQIRERAELEARGFVFVEARSLDDVMRAAA